jgi:hypothetical protein
MTDSFKDGLSYPWGNAKRLWNILWGLIPIVGMLALLGYIQIIVKSLAKGDTKGLPAFGSFGDNLVAGIKIIIFMIPTFAVLIALMFIPTIGEILYYALTLLVLPWLMINFLVKDEFGALWDIGKCFDAVFKNFGDYLLALIKTIVFAIIYFIASFVLVGIPCYMFGGNFYFVEFYRNNN